MIEHQWLWKRMSKTGSDNIWVCERCGTEFPVGTSGYRPEVYIPTSQTSEDCDVEMIRQVMES